MFESLRRQSLAVLAVLRRRLTRAVLAVRQGQAHRQDLEVREVLARPAVQVDPADRAGKYMLRRRTRSRSSRYDGYSGCSGFCDCA